MKKSFTSNEGASECGGLIQLSAPKDESEWPTVWKKTLEALGYPSTGNPFEGQFSGSTVVPDSVQPATKQRSYFANAYLESARRRKNLAVWTKAEAERILFDTSAEIIATGV